MVLYFICCIFLCQELSRSWRRHTCKMSSLSTMSSTLNCLINFVEKWMRSHLQRWQHIISLVGDTRSHLSWVFIPRFVNILQSSRYCSKHIKMDIVSHSSLIEERMKLFSSSHNKVKIHNITRLKPVWVWLIGRDSCNHQIRQKCKLSRKEKTPPKGKQGK
jgi:hypothetical protein